MLKPTSILIVAATENELPKLNGQFSNLKIDSLLTGVGMVATTFALTQKLMNSHFDLVINLGIAGAFSEQFEIGNVVQVTSDRLVELGAEDHDKFLTADKLGLVDSGDLRFESTVKVPSLKRVNGITVNRVHGNESSINKVAEQFNPDVESMEGAAVAYVCAKMKVSWVQVRSISNKVEPRNRDSWNIPLAIENLHKEVLVYLKYLNDEA